MTLLNVLLLELGDTDLLLDALQRAGFALDWRRVDTEADYLQHLAAAPDLILAGDTPPPFDALRAFHLLQERELDIPFIVVTGTNEAAAVECMKQGAADYLMKDRLARLGPAVTKALQQKQLRQEAAANSNAALYEQVQNELAERKQAEQAEREQRVLAEALADIAAALNSTLDLNEVLDRILVNVGRVVSHDGANIMFVEDGHAQVVRSQGYDAEDNIVESYSEMKLPVASMANFQRMNETGQSIVITDTRADPDWTIIADSHWVLSYVGAPIYLQGEVIGFLNLDSATPNTFTAVDGQRLQAFANQAAVAIGNARLYQELETYSESLEHAVQQRTQELRWAKERVETIVQNSSDAILLLRADGTLEMGNPATRELFGYSFKEIVNQGLLCLLTPKYTTPFLDAIAIAMRNGQRKRLEIVALHKDGSTLDVDVAIAPVKEGAVPAVVCSLRDISVLKEIERMKDNFVSNVSHELRTPITSLSLSHGLIKLNPQKQDLYLSRMQREIERLSRIIEDLLRLSRLDQDQVSLVLSVTDVNALVAQYVEDRAGLAQNAGLQLTAVQEPELPAVMADERLLGQVLSILLTNAINYTPAGGKITIQTQRQWSDSRHWIGFAVSDTGPGVPISEQSKLFQRFYRGAIARASGTAGTGLGLSIAKEIVHRHQGRIGVTSKESNGQGATFTVWLPAQ